MAVYPRLFVAKLAREVTNETLYEFFSRWVTVRFAKVVMDRDTGQSKGFGFVEVQSEDDVEQALQLDAYELCGRRIVVTRARERQ